jgi:hypothetical protein
MGKGTTNDKALPKSGPTKIEESPPPLNPALESSKKVFSV